MFQVRGLTGFLLAEECVSERYIIMEDFRLNLTSSGGGEVRWRRNSGFLVYILVSVVNVFSCKAIRMCWNVIHFGGSRSQIQLSGGGGNSGGETFLIKGNELGEKKGGISFRLFPRRDNSRFFSVNYSHLPFWERKDGLRPKSNLKVIYIQWEKTLIIISSKLFKFSRHWLLPERLGVDHSHMPLTPKSLFYT